jgi:hypothetical protein
MLEVVKQWVTPLLFLGRDLIGGPVDEVSEALTRRGLSHHVLIAHSAAISSMKTLETIDPPFGAWTECTVITGVHDSK